MQKKPASFVWESPTDRMILNEMTPIKSQNKAKLCLPVVNPHPFLCLRLEMFECWTTEQTPVLMFVCKTEFKGDD